MSADAASNARVDAAIVEVYFDFLSPYSWLALRACLEVERTGDAAPRFVPRAVVYGVILEAEGALGPGETAGKRLQAMRDVARIAALRGLELRGPPEHPFRSLDALRVVTCFEDHPQVLTLSARLADAAWQDGLDLTEIATLERVVGDVGLDGSGLAERIRDARIKDRLRDRTREAIEVGVCGVPTFRYGQSLFHGQDRLEHVRMAIAGHMPDVEDRARALAARPAGVRRRAAPPGR